MSETAPSVRAGSPACAGVEIWLVDLVASGTALDTIEAVLPRLPHDFPPGNAERRRSHVALRLLLERAGGSVRGAPFAVSTEGKPSLPGGPAFSLSHTTGHALIGIASDGAVIGVDVERSGRGIRMAAERAARIRAAGERLLPSAPPLAENDAGTLRAWVRLEALAKAEGTGMVRVLGRFGVLGRSASALRAEPADAAHAMGDCSGLAVTDLEPHGGVIAAVALPADRSAPAVQPLPAGRAEIEALLRG